MRNIQYWCRYRRYRKVVKMKDIKFRAWYKKEKIMCEVSAWTFMRPYSEFTLRDLAGFDVNGYEPVSGKTIELLAYTGLTDMKGEEIYEGHIVKRYCPCRNVGCTEFWVGEVAYRNGSLIFRDHQISVDSPLEMYAEEKFDAEEPDVAPLEIIGNIFEDYKLLKKGKK